MKKKGFTLVELLAVIAILAILVVIAMPNVLGMFNSSKKNTFVTEVQNILKQAATDYVSKSLEGFVGDGYNFTNTGTLKLNIETTKNYNIKLDSQGRITDAEVSDNSYCFKVTGQTDFKFNDVDEKNEDGSFKYIKDGAC